MQLIVAPFPSDNFFYQIAEQLIDENLSHYASEASAEMKFESEEELLNAVHRSIELCYSAGLPVNQNFKRIYKSCPDGIHVDWKISILAYQLIKLNGDATNPHVAEMQIHLLKQMHFDGFVQSLE